MEFQDSFKVYRDRTKTFSLEIIKLINELPKSNITYTLGNQLLRSATSVGANYRAACIARSVRERYSKMCIVVEEADETCYWLDLLISSEISNSEQLKHLFKEANELSRIMSSFRLIIKKKL
ncbi:MAG: four helix bundle protein [Bacteroidota bacterium]